MLTLYKIKLKIKKKKKQDSKCTQIVIFNVALKSTWIFKQIENKKLLCS